MSGELVRTFGEVTVRARAEDQYVDATALCKLSGKKWNNYFRNKRTEAFLNQLASEARIRVSDLVQSQKGNPTGNKKGTGQGTWIHPLVMVNFISWASPKFEVQVTKWAFELMTTGRVELDRPVAPAAGQLQAITVQLQAMQQQIDRLATLPQFQPLVPAVPRFTVRQRLDAKGWPTATTEQRRKIHKLTMAKIDACCPELSPDTAGGPGGGGPDRFHGAMLVFLDEAIDEVREACLRRERESGPGLFDVTG